MTRSIPACAGEPDPLLTVAVGRTVYPRVCGGTCTVRVERENAAGLSPRVRGNRRSGSKVQPSCGSIPACAGEPVKHISQRALPTVYPRVCGGTRNANGHHGHRAGLSPRVRGNLRVRGLCRDGGRSIPACAANRSTKALATGNRGSIPACAGEPTGRIADARSISVYPRVCGGTTVRHQSAFILAGLSPRVRGNRSQCPRNAPYPGSIPACAGEP